MHNQSPYRIHVYIDAANLHAAMRSLGYHLNYQRFYEWLHDKYKAKNIFLFMGYINKNESLYHFLEEIGFVLIFKQALSDGHGKMKGNCDSDLVLHLVSDYYERRFDKAIIVSSDGDFSSTVAFLLKKKAFYCLISPSKKCSILLRKLNIQIVYLVEQIDKLSN